MKRILILILIVFAAGCNSAKNAGGGSGASMQGIWTVTGNLGYISKIGGTSFEVTGKSGQATWTPVRNRSRKPLSWIGERDFQSRLMP